jgi:hypothetical protein
MKPMLPVVAAVLIAGCSAQPTPQEPAPPTAPTVTVTVTP